MLTRAALILAAAAYLPLPGCSSQNLQDINKDTDVALGWTPPDAGPPETVPDTIVDTQTIDRDADAEDTRADAEDGGRDAGDEPVDGDEADDVLDNQGT